MGFSEHVNGYSGSIKCKEFLEWISNWWFLIKDPAP
jgi:hypothetical protein